MTSIKVRFHKINSALFQRIDLRGRLMALAMAPVFVFAIVWGVYVVRQRAEDLEAQLQQRAQLLARQMAMAADYGIFSHNESALQNLTLAVSSEASVVAATIYSANYKILATHQADGQHNEKQTDQIKTLFQLAEKQGQKPANIQKDTWIAYLEPVRSPSLVVDDLTDNGALLTETHLQGYAVVEVSSASVRAEMMRFGLTVGALLVGVLSSGWLMARRFSIRIDRRIQQVALAAQRIGSGEPGVRLGPSDIATFDYLSQDINSMAAQLEHARQELEMRVDYATAALRDQCDAAEHANSAKTRFLAAASHDLRQPMYALSMLVAALKQDQTAALRTELLNRVEAATEAMSGLLDALLDISRLDAGGVQARIEPVQLQPLLQRLRETYEVLASRKNVEFFVLSSRLWVHSDPVLLERILSNFLSNAIRYTSAGGRVLVAVRQRGGTCLLQIRDNGSGIELEHQQAIFQEFVQIHNPQRDRSQGLGLGLAIVHRLSQLLEHPVELRSCPGHGSTFAVRVPVNTHATIAFPSNPTGGEGISRLLSVASAEGLQGYAILLIEDDTMVRESYQRLMQMWRCDVRAFADGESAIADLQSHPWDPQLIISDHRLGDGINGLELILAVRTHMARPIPAILVTGDTEEPALRQLDDAITRVLFKPVKPVMLKQTLKHFRHTHG